MRKNLNLKTSWYSKENWEEVIKNGYLPILAIRNPETHKGTPIHFPQLSPRYNLQEYREYLEERVVAWKIINSFDVLSHLSCAPVGVVLMTNHKEDPYREVLGDYLGSYLDTEVTEYEYSRD